MADLGSTAERISALRASAHPVRLRMLSLLTGSAMSAAEVARELGLTHANASYHLRTLLAAGELVEAGEERIRGGTAKRYRYPHERYGRALATERPSEGPSEGASEGSTDTEPTTAGEDQASYVDAVASELRRRLAARSRQAPRQSVHADLEGWVDPEVWDRARRMVEEAMMLLHEGNRPPRSPGTVHLSATTWVFRMDDRSPAVEP